MNNDLSLDLGFLIAYLIPGTLAVVLLAPSVPALCVSFSAPTGGPGRVVTAPRAMASRAVAH